MMEAQNTLLNLGFSVFSTLIVNVFGLQFIILIWCRVFYMQEGNLNMKKIK